MRSFVSTDAILQRCLATRPIRLPISSAIFRRASLLARKSRRGGGTLTRSDGADVTAQEWPPCQHCDAAGRTILLCLIFRPRQLIFFFEWRGSFYHTNREFTITKTFQTRSESESSLFKWCPGWSKNQPSTRVKY